MKTQMMAIEETPVYVARPDDGVKGGLIVIHEVWGLNDHTKDVAERFAAEGYLVVAPDLLADTPLADIDPNMMQRINNPDTRDEAQKELRALMTPLRSPEFGAATVAKLERIFVWLAKQPDSDGKVAVVGFCFGGTYSFALAATGAKLVGAVPFYGHASDDVAELKNITCPVLAFYGEDDHNLMAGLPELTTAMKDAGVDFRSVVYPKTGHAFFNDTNKNMYRADSAKDAWEQTKKFLAERFDSK